MASTAAHPFWILPLEHISEHASDGKTPEYLTGPDALYDVVRAYYKYYDQESSTALDAHYTESVWAKIYAKTSGTDLSADSVSPRQYLEVLPSLYVFPFNWADIPMRRVCFAGQPKFDAETCKDVLDTERSGSYSISYFSHSWDGDPYYHD